MEEVMLGSKRTIAFWRSKKRLLKLERALAPERQDRGRPAMPAQTLSAARIRDRIAAEAKRKRRFAEH